MTAARERGLLLNPPSWFTMGEKGEGFPMGYTQATGSEREEALNRLGQVLDRVRAPSPG